MWPLSSSAAAGFPPPSPLLVPASEPVRIPAMSLAAPASPQQQPQPPQPHQPGFDVPGFGQQGYDNMSLKAMATWGALQQPAHDARTLLRGSSALGDDVAMEEDGLEGGHMAASLTGHRTPGVGVDQPMDEGGPGPADDSGQGNGSVQGLASQPLVAGQAHLQAPYSTPAAAVGAASAAAAAALLRGSHSPPSAMQMVPVAQGPPHAGALGSPQQGHSQGQGLAGSVGGGSFVFGSSHLHSPGGGLMAPAWPPGSAAGDNSSGGRQVGVRSTSASGGVSAPKRRAKALISSPQVLHAWHDADAAGEGGGGGGSVHSPTRLPRRWGSSQGGGGSGGGSGGGGGAASLDIALLRGSASAAPSPLPSPPPSLAHAGSAPALFLEENEAEGPGEVMLDQQALGGDGGAADDGGWR